MKQCPTHCAKVKKTLPWLPYYLDEWEPQGCPESASALLALSGQGVGKGANVASSSLLPLQPEMLRSFDILGGRETGTKG